MKQSLRRTYRDAIRSTHFWEDFSIAIPDGLNRLVIDYCGYRADIVIEAMRFSSHKALSTIYFFVFTL